MRIAVSDNESNILTPFSFGIGDRFARQGDFQLKAFGELEKQGVIVTPVWNKSHREHKTVGSEPASVMQEAIQAVKNQKWPHAWHVDADHITLETVDAYIGHADFFTIDVADRINHRMEPAEQEEFLRLHGDMAGSLTIEGIDQPFEITEKELLEYGNLYWNAAVRAGEIYKYIADRKPSFIAEVSMDEVTAPQKPVELYFILGLLARQGVMLQTLAPKFTGRFNKGVDYEGDLEAFEKEFEYDLLVVKQAIRDFGLPVSLKLSVHTGSDKFSLYPIINRLVKKHDTGLHLKTAGTTWLEEVIGLALAGGKATELVRSIYRQAIQRFEELTGPYSQVLNIDINKLPHPEDFDHLSGEELADTIRHNKNSPLYNGHVRQLMHTAYKIAAENEQLIPLLKEHREIAGHEVYENIYSRHLVPLFL